MKRSLKILVLLMLSTTALYSQTVNMLSDTGNVGVGTTSPSTKLEVVGDTKLDGRLEIINEVSIKDSLKVDKKLTVEQDVKIKGQSVFDGAGKFKSDLRVLGTARMKEKLVVDSTANFKDKIVVDGLGRFNGDIKLTGDFIFGNNNRIGYLPASGGNPEIIGFGKGPNIEPGTPCTLPSLNVPTINQFGGMLQIWGYSDFNTTSGNINSLNIGYDGANGIIDMKGQQTDGNDAGLLINWYCGRNVAINTNPSKAGNVTMTSSSMGMVGIGITPETKLDVNGQITMRNGAQDGFIPVSDATGKMTWTDPLLITAQSVLWSENNNDIYFNTGNVGIGTTSPQVKLDVHGTIRTNYNPILLTVDDYHGLKWFDTYAGSTIDGPVLFGYSGGSLATNTGGTTKNILIWKEDGSVGIGTDKTAGFKLSVEGKIRAREIEVNADTWADYVFAKNYNLMPLEDLENFINTKNHLPNIPTAKEVTENGLNLGEMQIKQMEKIEELTLYLLEIKKQLDMVKEENKELKQLILKK